MPYSLEAEQAVLGSILIEAGDVVFLTEKRPHAAHLQNTLASVHRCNFVLAHQLFATMSSDELKKAIKEILLR